ncbi:MAG: hypothetical protein ACJ8GN_14840 [Longimicrobiaceae bacterium]
MRKNILLNVFNPDIRRRAGLYSSLSKSEHVRFLGNVLNVGVLLCKDYCVLPPGFVLLCDIARAAIELKRDFLASRYVRFPLREDNLDELLEKKRLEYKLVGSHYRPLYSRKSTGYLLAKNVAILPRKGKVGESIARLWERAPDEDPQWAELKQKLTAKHIEIMRAAPTDLHIRRVANTLPALVQWVSTQAFIPDSVIHHALQSSYGQIYFAEYDLAVLTNLPYVPTTFGLNDNTIIHDYRVLEVALRPLRLWPFLANAPAELLSRVRESDGYFAFSRLFEDDLAHLCEHRAIANLFALAATQQRAIVTETERVIRSLLARPRRKQPRHWEEVVGQISFTLLECAESVLRLDLSTLDRSAMIKTPSSSTPGLSPVAIHPNRPDPMISIFVALELEGEVLRERWGLRSDNNGLSWSGRLNDVAVVVFSPHEMGRVPAAVSTMRFLQSCREVQNVPEMLITVGIAGGFAHQGVQRGDLIIPDRIVDLATRKIFGGAQPRTQFRPRTWDTDERLGEFLQFMDFDVRQWAFNASRAEEWHYDESRYPKVLYGPMTSLDEIVSSEEWVAQLCSAEPKLLGVEMEAGGVCAAAATFGMRVAVIRGISDHADPAKTDDLWRVRALKTGANLLEHVRWNEILRRPGQ